MFASCWLKVPLMSVDFRALEEIGGSNGWARFMVGASERIIYSGNASSSPQLLESSMASSQNLSYKPFTTGPSIGNPSQYTSECSHFHHIMHHSRLIHAILMSSFSVSLSTRCRECACSFYKKYESTPRGSLCRRCWRFDCVFERGRVSASVWRR